MTAPVKPEPQVAPAPAPARSPFISPGRRKYMHAQMDAIKSRGGDVQDLQQFVEMELKAPFNAIPVTTVDAMHPDTDVSNLRGVSMALVQGATFGFGDEAVGSMLGLLTGSGARVGVEEYRAEYDAWAKQHRAVSFGAELAGGLATGGIFGAGKTVLGTVARGAAAGALAGAGAAPGTDLSWDAVGERMKYAMIGSTVGAVTGGTLQLGTKYAGPVVQRGVRAVIDSKSFGVFATALDKTSQQLEKATVGGMRVGRLPLVTHLVNVTPEGRARELVFKYMDDFGVSPTALMQRASAAWVRGERPTVVDLMGDPFLEFARDVLKDHNPAAQTVMQEFMGRQIKQGEQLLGQLLVRSLDNPKFATANIYTVAEQLHKFGSQESTPFYNSARAQAIKVNDAIRAQFEDADVREAWNSGAKLFNDELDLGLAKGLRVPLLPSKADIAANDVARARFLKANPGATKIVDTVFPVINSVPDELPVSGIDYARRYLRVPVERRFAAADPLNVKRLGVRDNELNVIKTRYNILRDETIAQVPDFGKALLAYSGPHASRDAIDLGIEAFKTRLPAAHVKKQLAELAPRDRDFYRLGAAIHLNDRMQSATDPLEDVASSLFGGSLIKFDRAGKPIGRFNADAERALALFPDNPKGAEDFVRLIAGQANLSKTVGRTVSLPRQISAQKLVQAEVGAVPPARGNVALNVATTIRQEQSNLAEQLSLPEKKALAEMFGRGLADPGDFRELLHDFAYQHSKKPLHLSGRAKTTVTQTTTRGLIGAVAR